MMTAPVITRAPSTICQPAITSRNNRIANKVATTGSRLATTLAALTSTKRSPAAKATPEQGMMPYTIPQLVATIKRLLF